MCFLDGLQVDRFWWPRRTKWVPTLGRAGLVVDDIADNGTVKRVAHVLVFFFLFLLPLPVSHEEVEAGERKHRGANDGDDNCYSSTVDR